MQVPLLPGVGAEASRGRLDPEKGPWRAVGKLQVARVNRRQTCTGTFDRPINGVDRRALRVQCGNVTFSPGRISQWADRMAARLAAR